MITSSAVLFALTSLLSPSVQSDLRAPEGCTLLVLNKSDNTLDFIDPNDGERLATLATGEGPHEVAVSPDGRQAVVANYGHASGGNTLAIYDTASRTHIKTIRLDGYERPHGIVFVGPQRVLVTAESQQSLIEVDLEEGRVVRDLGTAQVASHMVAAAEHEQLGARAYVTNIGSGSLTVFDLTSGARLANIPTGAGAEGLAVTPDGSEVWVANRAADTISIVDAESLEVVEVLPCAKFPIRLQITGDGRYALASNAYSAEVVLFDVADRAELVRVPMQWTAVEGSEDNLITHGESPVPIGIQLQPDGRFAYIANTNANLITVLDLERFTIASRFSAGAQPDGLAWVPQPTDR